MGLRPQQAEEVMQIVWAKFLQKGPTFSEETEAVCRAWLAEVIRNEVITFFRALARRPEQWPDNFDPPARSKKEKAARHAVLLRRSALFRRWLEEMGQENPLRRDLVFARHILGVEPKDLAEMHGKTAHWISVQINRALDDFRAWLVKHEHDNDEEEA